MMMLSHPDEATLERFMHGQAQGAEGRRVVAHLLSGCEQCRSVTSAEWSKSVGLSDQSSPRHLADLSAVDAALRLQRQDVGKLWSRMEDLPHARRRVLVQNSRRYQTLGLCELLMEMAFDLGFDQPAEALPVSELALDVAEHLDADELGEALVFDYRARALGYRANALRVNSDFRMAESLLGHAMELLERGSGDILEQARLLRFQAYLASDRKLSKEAIRLLRRSIRIYRRVGDRGQANRLSITLGAFLNRDQRPEMAVKVLARTLETLDQNDVRVVLGCRHNLAHSLKACGRLNEALEVLADSQELYSESGDRMMLLKLRTLEGEVATVHNRPALAERAFRAAIHGYEHARIPYDAALVALKLAALCLERGRHKEVLELSAKLHRTFADLDTSAEALTAISLFHEAARREAVTEAVLADVQSRLETARHS